MKKTFAYHKPSAGGLEKITTLREAFSRLHDIIEQTAPASREKAVVCNDPESEATV